MTSDSNVPVRESAAEGHRPFLSQATLKDLAAAEVTVEQPVAGTTFDTFASVPRWLVIVFGLVAMGISAAIFSTQGITNFFAIYALAVPIYLVVIMAVSTKVEGIRHAIDRAVTAVVASTFVLALFPLISVLQTVITAGVARFDGEFFTHTMTGVFGSMLGGALHAIVGTLVITLLTCVFAIPIGVLAAIFLTEYGDATPLTRWFASLLRFFVDVMTGIPSIVAGLFAYAVFSMDVLYGIGARAGVIGAVALLVLMIPIVVRNTEEMLMLVSRDLREASYALGVPKWRTIVRVVLPTSIGGIATGITLAIARVIGETAPLLVTAGNNVNMNWNPLHDRMATLPYFTYINYMQPGIPIEGGINRAWAGALTLIIIVMVLNVIARAIAWRFAPKKR